MNNDQQVQNLLYIVIQKQEALVKPTVSYKTNCVFPLDGNSSKNLRTVTNIEEVIGLTALLINHEENHVKACNILGVELDFKYGMYSADDWISDLQMITETIMFKKKEKELNTIKSSLENLMSKEMKDSIELQKLMTLIGNLK